MAANVGYAIDFDPVCRTPLISAKLSPGDSPAMKSLIDRVQSVSETGASVLVVGENGSGKEVVSQLLMELGTRAKGPKVTFNSAAIPKELVESEMFGHVKGAFTGASIAKKGKFEQADGGRLFMDEIGDMSLEVQSKLLRVLQDQIVTPVGAKPSGRSTSVSLPRPITIFRKMCEPGVSGRIFIFV